VRQPTALVVAVIVAALTLTGCIPGAPESPSTSGIPDADAALVLELRSQPFDGSKVTIVTQALERAGVAIAATWDPEGSEVVRITPWQVQNMTAEAANDGGVSGAELAAVSPTPEGAPPIGYLISAWAISYDSDAARLAHALLGEQDFTHPDTILFPSLVTTLFLADATADIDARDVPIDGAAGEREVATATLATTLAAGPCTAVTNFIQRAIATVVNALKVDVSGGGFFGFLGRIWNKAVDLAAALVKGLLDAVTRPVVQVLTTIFGAIETIRQLSTYLMVWRATVTAKPETNVFGIDTNNRYGRLKLEVVDNRLPIPDVVLDCAEAFDVDLRSAGSAAGSKVNWVPTNMARPDLSKPDSVDALLGQNQSADYGYVTGHETEKESKGEEHAGLLKVVASVERNDIEKIRKLFTALIFDQVPSSIRGIVQSVAGPILDAATRHLTAITDVRSTGYVAITFHSAPPSSTPTSPPADAAPPVGSSECPSSLLPYLQATYGTGGTVVNQITPAQFVDDYAGVLPGLTDGRLPSCAFQLVHPVGVGHEFGYFIGADQALVDHAVGVMNGAGYSEMAGTTGIYEDGDGRTASAAFTPAELATLPGVVFPDQVVVIQGPQIGSL
jgi:hypothetical protein